MDWTQRATCAVPAGQPDGVQPLAQRLFPAYTVDGGRLHLAGCALEDRLFARLRYQAGDAALSVYVDAEGQELPYAQAEALGLIETTPVATPSPQWGLPANRFFTLVAPRLAQRPVGGQPGELTEMTLIWCKFAEGKLRFTIGDESVDLAFADWARTLAPPPFVCPHTGASTFHLAATDDGRIVAVEQIGRCAQTGRRTILKELVTCSVTGRQVLAAVAPPCPVCGKPVCKSAQVSCSMCGEEVSPAVIESGRCLACRTLRSIDAGDRRLACLLHEHPGLARWRSWQWGDTARVSIAVASGWWKRLLLVFDKETLAIRRVAVRQRLESDWTPVNQPQQASVLRE